MAVESDGEQMIIVSVDMEGFPETLVKLPKEEIFVGDYYNKEELKKLIQMTKGKLL